MAAKLIDNFWRGKKVFITGHTGFKGSWLSLWLLSLGADVTGYALHPPTKPSLFELCGLSKSIHSVIGDVRDEEKLRKVLIQADPDIIFHLAAQPLVNQSYQTPVETYAVNVMGTIHLLEAVKSLAVNTNRIRAVINITSDKCYENKEWNWGYREIDRLGGYDPYSNSKACSELVTCSYRNSFFNPDNYESHGIGLATARAGNVIGGGDFAKDRLIPDCIRSFLIGEKLKIRNPGAVRPWQHVLEPLGGYLMLAEKLYSEGRTYGEAWNFGPFDDDTKSVEWIIKKMIKKWDNDISYDLQQASGLHEAKNLKLDCSKAIEELGWHPRWNIDQAIDKVIEWAIAYRDGQEIKKICLNQISEYI
ncbi:CDP-glucose 4,6-dehydratase [Metabacillus elymi]|uniref:CDP-glucose 4,6-dehydratase n=1 Tax=Metabacillus elymi TaxID=2745198 RepID=A0ABX6S6J1_9BACI|nr:CDP-glucose 4,6-dehydratase [Metabacillus sp. KUDC1714]QNF28471.1 CDP-glucose 4,6-dehydratase [Metabacillus sp. KUDC1714]